MTGTTTTTLTRPAWAEHHEQEDTGVRWSRHLEVEVLSGNTHIATDTIAVEAYQHDRLWVDETGTVRVDRDGAPEILVGAHEMTIAQAWLLVDALRSVLDTLG